MFLIWEMEIIIIIIIFWLNYYEGKMVYYSLTKLAMNINEHPKLMSQRGQQVR